jgi:hypothetical protein
MSYQDFFPNVGPEYYQQWWSRNIAKLRTLEGMAKIKRHMGEYDYTETEKIQVWEMIFGDKRNWKGEKVEA